MNPRKFLRKTPAPPPSVPAPQPKAAANPESLFPEPPKAAPTPAPAPAPPATPPFMNPPTQPAPLNANNVLSSDVEIKGTIVFKTDLFLDGKLEGEITSPAMLHLGENAQVDGEIKTGSVIIRGIVNGNVTVEDRCELRGEAQLVGDLKAARLVMEQDATLVGKSDVTPKKNSTPPRA